MDLVKRLWKEEEGQGMVEYVLILALIAIAAIVAVRAVGGSLNGVWQETKENLDNSITTP